MNIYSIVNGTHVSHVHVSHNMLISSRPTNANICRWIGLLLFLTMACRFPGAEPLPEPMPDYYIKINKFLGSLKVATYKNS